MMKHIILAIIALTATGGCAVALQAPEKPLEINLNVKVDHQISVKVDKAVDDLMKNNKDIF